MRDPTADASRMTDTTVEYFVSDLFAIEPGEDDFTNPYRFGKQLAYWLEQRLSEHGYHHVTVTPEDWGWCVMCSREEGMLWVGCASYIDGEIEEGHLPAKKDIIWHCFATIEQPLLKRLFSSSEGKNKLEKLKKELKRVIHEEESFRIVQEPE